MLPEVPKSTLCLHWVNAATIEYLPIVEHLPAHSELEQGRQAFSRQYLQSENTVGFIQSNCCNKGWSMFTMYKHPMRNL